MSEWIVIAGNVGALAALGTIVYLVWQVRGHIRAGRNALRQYRQDVYRLGLQVEELEVRVRVIEEDLYNGKE